ncbi:hypothetical protein CapIbe_020208 [Capra ibex]
MQSAGEYDEKKTVSFFKQRNLLWKIGKWWIFYYNKCMKRNLMQQVYMNQQFGFGALEHELLLGFVKHHL